MISKLPAVHSSMVHTSKSSILRETDLKQILHFATIFFTASLYCSLYKRYRTLLSVFIMLLSDSFVLRNYSTLTIHCYAAGDYDNFFLVEESEIHVQ